MDGKPKRQVTLKHVAQRTGYSINTVSRALKDSPGISLAAREKIRRAASEMGYIKNEAASSMRSGMTRTIAVIVGDIVNPHFSIMVKEIEIRARERGYSTIALNTDESAEREREAIHLALSKQVDGIILCPVQQGTENVGSILHTGVPLVLIGRHFEQPMLNAVVCDDIGGAQQATDHLLELGHTRIAFLNTPGHTSSARERLEGYRRALQRHGVRFVPSLVHTVALRQEQRLPRLKQILSQPDFSAVFAFSDMIAWEAIGLLIESGWRVPEDISVVGFDNIQSRLAIPFPLTTIRTSKALMSTEAVEMLIGQIESPDALGGLTTKKVIATSLAVRGSTSRPAAKE